MIEIVFTDSAAGSLRTAKSLGTAAGGIDGSPSDVFSFSYAFDVGPIANGAGGTERFDVLTDLYSVYPFGDDAAKTLVASSDENRRRLEERASSEEPIRIWYSSEPDELCGYLWAADFLQQLPEHGPVQLVRLPQWEDRPDGTIVFRIGCGELEPGEWNSLLQFAREAPSLLLAGRQFDWRVLQTENAPLRAVISGRVVSVPASFYDFLILDAIGRAETEFPEALVIGNVLGRSQIGISDAWLAKRIGAMVAGGLLEEIEPVHEDNAPAYHRMLRKTAALGG